MVKNKKRLFVASFITLLVAGLFTGLRASILGDWGTQFGFTKSELGAITGGGFVGFGIVILISSALAEKVGYGKLMWLAFALHILSAVTTIAATPIYGDGSSGNEGAYWLLYVGMFLFAIAWGICESTRPTRPQRSTTHRAASHRPRAAAYMIWARRAP